MSDYIIPCPVCHSTDIKCVMHANGICGPGFQSYKVYDYCGSCGVFLHPDRAGNPVVRDIEGVVSVPDISKGLLDLSGSIPLSSSGTPIL